MFEHDRTPVNPTANRPFEDVLAKRIERRTVLAGGLAVAAGSFLIGSPVTAPVAARTPAQTAVGGSKHQSGTSGSPKLIGFEAIPLDSSDKPTISPDYQYTVLAPWGTAVDPNAPGFVYPPKTAADQERQVGLGHDGMWFFPLSDKEYGNRRGLLCVNHEYGLTTHALGKELPESLEEVRIMQAVHGMSILDICQTEHGAWEVIPNHRSRRITVNTPVEFSGPVADTPLLANAAGNPPAGTVNNCGNGYTPWGTYLTCEENFNGYFGATDEWTPTEEQERYGFTTEGFGYGWERFDRRFDLSDPEYRNEANRFGWIVEVHPKQSNRSAVKRTALGRFKHEGVALTIGRDERAVAYMGDDQRFDYIYKYVSSSNCKHMLAQGQSPLDDGQLFVAKFDDDGSGRWLELTIDNPDLAARFNNQAEVLTFARLAADIVGATPMDRPEWTTVAPNGDVFCTLTNNTDREEPNAANPEAPNETGHIIRWRDSDNHIGTSFEWDIFVLASDVLDTEAGFGSPDGLWADPDGRLFIETDGDQPDGANNQLLVADTETGEIRRLLTGVPGSEVTGIAVTPDRRTMFVNIQHAGDGDPDLTLFPDFEHGVIPRDATLVITRTDGGIIGS